MNRKNIFNFVVIYIISFLSLFYNFDIKINKNDNSKYIKFVILNKVYANENNYEYSIDTPIVRRNKTDPNLNGSFSKTATSWISNLSWIPGIGSMIQSFVYIGQGLSFSGDDIKNAFTGDISSILTGAGMVMDVLAMGDGESNSVIALDQTFSSNLYCRYQNIYEEETDLIHKSGPATRGGLEHSIFPIYPLDIKVNDETGLCDLEKSGVIDNDKNFINIGDADRSSNHLQPSTTKCSYSYTAASEQCVKELSSPILTAYNAQKTIADTVCILADLKGGAIKKSANKISGSINKLKKGTTFFKGLASVGSIAWNSTKIFGMAMAPVMRAVLLHFTDNRFVYDPVNLMAILGVEFTFGFLMTALTGIPTNPAEVITYFICLGTTIGAYATFTYGSKAAMAIIANKHYKKARDAIKNYKFCGYDWFTYAKTPDGKYYTKGINDHSYYKKIYDCINGVPESEGGECGAISGDDVCVDDGKTFCNKSNTQKISKYDKNIKNKIFREYVYGGKEYDSGAIEENILNSGKNFDNRIYLFKDGGYNHYFCIDPRTPDQKGFKSIYQKYYMRGNDKANFACNRFYYDGKSPCILYEEQVLSEDKNKMYEKYDNGKYYLLPDGDKELLNKYSKQCQESFMEARKCCQYRSRHLICLENQQTNNNSFCFSNVVEEYSDENTKLTSNIVDLLNNIQNDGDFFKYTCELDGIKFEATKKLGTDHVCVFSYGLCPFDFKLNAGLNYKATYCDANMVDPNLDLNNTVKRESTHFNADDCRKGMFSADMREDYKKLSKSDSKFVSYIFDKVSKDMNCTSEECEYNRNDFKTIYDSEKVKEIINKIKDNDSSFSQFSTSELRILSELGCNPSEKNDCLEKFNIIFDKGFEAATDVGNPNIAVIKYNLSQYLVNNLKTSAYGQIKNFCQYRAHCVEVEEESLTEQREDSATLFMDSSCTGYTNNSRNLLQGSVAGLPRQLSAPMVECIHESLKNLINGVAGNSLCLEGHAINNEGFCDSDTAEDVETAIKNKDTEFFSKKYQTRFDDIENKSSYIVKGQLLPTNYNPFLKLQRRFINVIKTALALFLVLYFYKLFLLGKLGDFTKPENISKLVFNLFKFSLVFWLIFYNGWQQGVTEHLVNFSSGTFNFVNSLLIKIINNPNNQMLSLKGDKPKQLNIEKYDRISEAEDEDFKAICYRYDIFNNINYRVINELTGYCDDGYTRVEKNQIYIAEKEDKTYQEKGKLVISTNQEMAKLISFIDEYNDNNSNKLNLYRIDSNNQTVSIAADSEPKGEDLYGEDPMNYKSSKITQYDKDNVWSKYYDGCYFDTTEYKEGKGYLALFDTLDCKFIRYLGFSTDRMVPNLIIFSAMMIVPNYLFEGVKADQKGVDLIKRVITKVGSVLFGLVMSFVFIMFNVVIKVLYIFLSSFFTLSILIFVSPIVLPLIFYERTKKMVDTWFELIIDTVIKPTFNLCIMIFYINLLDIFLLKNVMFIKHDWRGRGASLECFSGSASSFVCLINNLIGGISSEDIKGLFADGLMSFLLDMLMIIMLFTLSDSMLETFDSIVKEIFNFVSNGSGASVMGLSGGNSIAGSEGKSTEDIILGSKTGQKDENGNEKREGGAMGAGRSLESFRANYLAKAPGAALDSFIKKTSKIGKGTLGKGLNQARQFLRDKDDQLRTLASRLVNIEAKRAIDNIKAKAKIARKNAKNWFKNIGSSEKKMEKLRKKIDKEETKLNKLNEEDEKRNKRKFRRLFFKSTHDAYYNNNRERLEENISKLKSELEEREQNGGKLTYTKLSNAETEEILKKAEKEKKEEEKEEEKEEAEKKKKKDNKKKKKDDKKEKKERKKKGGKLADWMKRRKSKKLIATEEDELEDIGESKEEDSNEEKKENDNSENTVTRRDNNNSN